jgi:hypothetical protein
VPSPTAGHAPDISGHEFVNIMSGFSQVLAIKLYRLRLESAPGVPIIPCLDHEAMLHEEVAPHIAAYVEDQGGDLHEVTCIPSERRIHIDAVSTLGERSDASLERLVSTVGARVPGFASRIAGPSWIRGDLRVAKACRAQVALRDVLTGKDLDRTKAAIDRLQIISSLMEKESRVASWGARTVMTPILAVVGFLTFQILASLRLPAEYGWIGSLRYVVVGSLGAYFLYYGVKAVQLTQMANRVWKRSAEYGLILAERRRLLSSEAIDRQSKTGVR